MKAMCLLQQAQLNCECLSFVYRMKDVKVNRPSTRRNQNVWGVIVTVVEVSEDLFIKLSMLATSANTVFVGVFCHMSKLL